MAGSTTCGLTDGWLMLPCPIVFAQADGNGVALEVDAVKLRYGRRMTSSVSISSIAIPLLALEYLPRTIATEVTFPALEKWCLSSVSLMSFDKLLMYNFVFTCVLAVPQAAFRVHSSSACVNRREVVGSSDEVERAAPPLSLRGAPMGAREI